MPSEIQLPDTTNVLDRVGQLLDYLDYSSIGGATDVPIDEVRDIVEAQGASQLGSTHRDVHVLVRPGVGNGKVRIGNQDISEAVTGLVVTADGSGISNVHLDLTFVQGEVDMLDDAEVVLPEHTTRALLALGWTPPTAAPPRPGTAG